jgi:(p)ppGpp synthase/HD superfamily hydrolase
MTYQQERLKMAEFIATEAHQGQTRRGSASPYMAHCTRVAEAAQECQLSLDAVVAAYLHDVVEDCEGWTFARLLNRGVSERAVQLVALLTKEKIGHIVPPTVWDVKAAKERYYDGILGDDDAVALKLLDRADNLRDAITLVGMNRSWVVAYYQKTVAEFPRLVDAAISARSYLAARAFGDALLALDDALTPGNIAHI